ncbi:uncharacterized protein BO87DRAFT_27268 [Aspergillus neoniger CBS 115656]|uniref:Uncharacterized protein n=1 Tax=Aspergillus neoniger (strain CBS 115656) TaxID=1448310 RepID=A0A318YL91_ASPNB|nr:hypothetical protein BO87DRAFT_27268 [Aspergillus neoniger CBS 115656]PYH35335.1 hypothetical protein BO87DRAFT_27268 [Aspergillus neoniger CBS 115656]
MPHSIIMQLKLLNQARLGCVAAPLHHWLLAGETLHRNSKFGSPARSSSLRCCWLSLLPGQPDQPDQGSIVPKIESIDNLSPEVCCCPTVVLRLCSLEYTPSSPANPTIL